LAATLNSSLPNVIQLPQLTWRFWCSCVVLAAASGYVLLGALQIASVQRRAPAIIAAAPADAAEDNADNEDNHDGGDGDDDEDDASHSDARPAAGPQGGAGAATADTSFFCSNDSFPLRLYAAEILRLLAQRKAAAAATDASRDAATM
jgi:hypothetical protein